MATAGAVMDYHEGIYEEQDAQAAYAKHVARRVLAVEQTTQEQIAAIKRDVADINAALAKLTEMVMRAMNLARWHGEEVGHVEMLLAETVSRVQVVEEALGWDAHDGRTMYGETAAPVMPLADAAA